MMVKTSMQTTNSEHLLLFRSTQWDKGLSPEQIQEVMLQWAAWLGRLSQQGKVRVAQPLAYEGKIVSGKKATVADGPFAESKEAIGGYFLLQVGMDEAVEIAKECPGLKYGVTVEVRPVAEQCAPMKWAGEQLARETSAS
jgi:hypothetical protein